MLARRTRVGWGCDRQCEEEGCSAWGTRFGRVAPPTAALRSSPWGAPPSAWVGEPLVDGQCGLDPLGRPGPGSWAGLDGGRGLPDGGVFPESGAASSGGPGLSSRPAPTPSAAFSLSSLVTVCPAPPDADPLLPGPRFLCIPPAGLARPSPSALPLGAGWGASGSPPTPQALL